MAGLSLVESLGILKKANLTKRSWKKSPLIRFKAAKTTAAVVFRYRKRLREWSNMAEEGDDFWIKCDYLIWDKEECVCKWFKYTWTGPNTAINERPSPAFLVINSIVGQARRVSTRSASSGHSEFHGVGSVVFGERETSAKVLFDEGVLLVGLDVC